MPAMVVRELAAWLEERGGSLVAGEIPPALDRSVEGVARPRRFIPRELDTLDAHDVVFAAADVFTATAPLPLDALVTTLAESQAALVVSGLPARDAASDLAPYLAADSLAFPLFTLPAQTDVAAAMRVLAGDIQERQVVAEREAREAQSVLARARRHEDTIPFLAAALAQHTHLACVVEDARRVSLTCALPGAALSQETVEAALTSYAARRAVRPATPGGLGEDIPVQRRLPGDCARAIIPLSVNEAIIGYLSLLGPDAAVTPRTVELLWRVAPAFVPALHAMRAQVAPPRPTTPDLLAALLDASLPEGEITRLAAERRLDVAAPHALLLARPLPGEADAAQGWARDRAEALTRTAPLRLVTVRDQALCLLISDAEATDTGLDTLANALGHGDDVAIGVGRTATGIVGWRQSWEEAQQALQAALRLPARRRLRYADLGVLQLLLPLHDAAAVRAFGQATLAPLLSSDPHETLLMTLEMFFATNGNTFQAAQRLGLHRNTLTYRLNRIQELLGVTLDDPEVRLALHLALKIRQVSDPAL